MNAVIACFVVHLYDYFDFRFLKLGSYLSYWQIDGRFELRQGLVNDLVLQFLESGYGFYWDF